jgi:hypothetical protein
MQNRKVENMTYSHAERNLAAIRHLTIQTIELLENADDLDADAIGWLRESTRHLPQLAPSKGGPGAASNELLR